MKLRISLLTILMSMLFRLLRDKHGKGYGAEGRRDFCSEIR